MTKPVHLFELNPAVDRADAASRFAADRRVQIRDILTTEAAQALHQVISRMTPWGLAWQAGPDGPHALTREALSAGTAQIREIGPRIDAAMRGRDYAFVYSQYRLLEAYLEQRDPGGPHDIIFEHINSEPLLDLVREVTGMTEIIKADAQATLFAPNHFLSVHDDTGSDEEGRRIAYVLGLCDVDWRPDWGGYLLFLDENDDVVAGYRPRFNALNMFEVPARHNVSYVPPFAPVARFALTGWFRDR